jgi:hypothetical protein
MTIFRIILILILVVVADFVLWRRWREEYTDEEIFSFSLVVGLLAAVGGVVGAGAEAGHLEWGISGWGAAVAAVTGVVWWSRMRQWDAWETLDGVTPVGAWLWALLVLLIGRADGHWVQVAVAWLGLGVVAIIRLGYRRWRWYKSGKMGLVFLGWLGWFAVAEITVAFLAPGGIYWGGLKASQLVGAYMLAFVIVAIYWRSGRKIKEDFGWMRRLKNDKK